MPCYKCVGGPNDGQSVEMESNVKDIVLFHSLSKEHWLHRSTVDELSPYCTDDTAIIVETHYTLRNIQGTGNDGKPYDVVRFLAPEDWTDHCAIQYQFTK